MAAVGEAIGPDGGVMKPCEAGGDKRVGAGANARLLGASVATVIMLAVP